MAPKTASAKAAAPKKSAAPAAHGTYQDMIKDAIIQLKERNGSSRQTLKKYVQANNSLGSISDATFTSRFNAALAKGSETGAFARPKGASGPVKLGKPADKTTKATSPAATKATKPKTATKATTTKAAAPKKAATKKSAATTKAAAPKKTATKANTGKSRKTAAPAPAVEDKPATVLGKTKSGRVTKNKAPVSKPATKKAAPKKTAAPKKAAAKK